MFDPNRTLKLVTGALFSPRETWQAYRPEAEDWKKTAFLITGPVIILTAILAWLVGLIGGGGLFGFMRPTLLSTAGMIVLGAIWAGIVALIVAKLAGVFGGKGSFALGLAATTFAFIPGYFGQVLSQLPWIGWLLGFALFIWSLVLLWRIIPGYLDVPAGKRAGHYIVSLVVCIVAGYLAGFVLRPLLGPTVPGMYDTSTFSSRGDAEGRAPGIFGTAMRQAELIAASEEDRYAPPADGKLDEDQVEEFIRVMDRVRDVSVEQAERVREIAERADRDEEISLSDMSQMMSGAAQIAGMNTVELEVVKSGGGNWAEHSWVKEALRTAWMQKDINDAVAHNYALYQKYEPSLRQHIAL